MREIKFRGKLTLGKHRWVKGFYVRVNDNHVIIPGGIQSLLDYKRCEPETIGQFTGLTDKDGKEIYEGDIIECVSWNEYWTDGSGKPMERMRRRMLVGYENGAFVCLEHQDAPFYDKVWSMITNQDCIIVGNRFDNPDLWPWSAITHQTSAV